MYSIKRAMPGYSRNQARVASSLVNSPRTAKELRDELGLPLNELEKDLAKLIKLGVVEKLGGYPTKYQAIGAVRQGIMGEKATEEHVFTAHIIIEGQAKEKKALEDAMQEMIGRLKKDTVIAASNFREDEMVHEEGFYTTLFEADIAAKRFEDLVYTVLTYGPSSIELDPIQDYTLITTEAQAVVMDVATMLQAYASTLVQKDIALQEYRKNSKELFIK